MANKKLLAVGVVLVMVFVAGCSSNKSADSGNTNGTGADGGSSASGAYDPNAANNGGSDSSESDAATRNSRTIYFGYDQSTLSSDSQSVLDNNIVKFKNGSQHIRIEGNTDERGTREYNLALGERRADAVLQYLVANGIAKSRLETISYGKERPADPGHDEAAWAKNRRVELVY